MSEFEIPTTPEYYQSEVDYFHPYLQIVLERVIEQYYEGQYEVLHHEYIGMIESDLIVKNRSTGRYQLMIEVKRSPEAINSTRNQLQARSYITEANPAELAGENPYYVLTNIEKTELFRYSSDKPSVHQQKIKQGPFSAGNFTDNSSDFFNQCVEIFNEILSISINDSGEYVQSNQVLNTLLRRHKDNYPEWHKTFVTTGFEYIRGALSPDSWDEAIRYKNSPERLVAKGQSVDFENIFKEPHPDSNQPDLWEQDYLKEIYKNGSIHKSGDDLAQISFSIIAEGRENQGLVPTDIELARLLSIILNECLSDGLADDKIVCDPAAGTGSLLSSFSLNTPGIQPRQVWANEIESEMMEPLSLVLGLNFPSSISRSNSPRITSYDVLELSQEEFENVQVLTLNPPFMSGVKSSGLKKNFSERISELKGSSALNIGQVGLEGLFMELVLNLVPANTLFGLVFPKQFLLAKGQEANAIRKYLIEEFNLKYILNYPSAGIFENVVKATCLLIGEKDVSSDFVKSVQILTPLTDLDLDDFKRGLRNIQSEEGEGSVCYGVNYKTIKSEDLLDSYDESWAFISQARYAAEKWLNDNLSDKTVRLSDIFNTRRGRVANQGGSHLIFPDYNSDTWNLLEGLIPEDWLKPGIRVVDSCNDIVIKASNAPNQVLAVDKDAFEEDHNRHKELLDIVQTYIENLEDSSSSQTKKKKSVSELLVILQAERRYISEQYTVLIPRNIRRNARVFLAETPIYATTNLVEAYGRSREDQYLLASWVLSVFAQLHFEYMAKDQEGTRKLETTGQIYDLYVPNFEDISSDQKQQLISLVQADVKFLNLYNPSSREIDEIWAEILWPNNSESKMNKAFDLMYDLVYERDPK